MDFKEPFETLGNKRFPSLQTDVKINATNASVHQIWSYGYQPVKNWKRDENSLSASVGRWQNMANNSKVI